MGKNIKELLIISSGYPNKTGEYLAHTFVKGYVDEAKEFFDKVIVLVLLPYIPFVLRKFISKYPKLLKSYSYDNVYVEYKKYPYIPIWPLKKYKGNIAFFLYSNWIIKLLKKDFVIHANFTSPAGVFAYLLSKATKKPYVLTVHEDHDWLVKEVNSNNPIFIKTWENAKTIIRVNKLDNALLSQFNNNIVTIPNGFNHRKFNLMDKNHCKKKLNISKTKQVIINIGFYNNQKNQKLLIEAIELLPENLKNNIECFIIGGGTKQIELENYTKKLGVEKSVKIVGQVKHEILPLYLNAADIFCLSSNSEGNPTVMFEALAVGIPYVGTNVGGVSEVIISESYGLLCSPRKKEKLRDLIISGLSKSWNRNEIIEYSNQFSWKNIFLLTKQNY